MPLLSGKRDSITQRSATAPLEPVTHLAVPSARVPTQAEIAEAAYYLWEASFHDADPESYWRQAERDLCEHNDGVRYDWRLAPPGAQEAGPHPPSRRRAA